VGGSGCAVGAGGTWAGSGCGAGAATSGSSSLAASRGGFGTSIRLGNTGMLQRRGFGGGGHLGGHAGTRRGACRLRAAAGDEALHAGNFFVRQTGQRRTLAGDACFSADVDQVFAVELQFFGKRINPSDQALFSLRKRPPARHLWAGPAFVPRRCLLFRLTHDLSPRPPPPGRANRLPLRSWRSAVLAAPGNLPVAGPATVT
jgi:hypothetical protein